MATVRQLSAETQIFAINVTSGGPLFSQTGTYTVYASDTYAGIDHTTFTLTTKSGQQLLTAPSVDNNIESPGGLDDDNTNTNNLSSGNAALP